MDSNLASIRAGRSLYSIAWPRYVVACYGQLRLLGLTVGGQHPLHAVPCVRSRIAMALATRTLFECHDVRPYIIGAFMACLAGLLPLLDVRYAEHVSWRDAGTGLVLNVSRRSAIRAGAVLSLPCGWGALVEIGTRRPYGLSGCWLVLQCGGLSGRAAFQQL